MSSFKSTPGRRSAFGGGRRRTTYAPRPRTGGNRRTGQYIDPRRFVRVAQAATAQQYTAQHSFDDFQIAQVLKANLAHIGYQTPSPIQDQTIPVALAGTDVIGIANTGTGKTAAFAIPLLDKLMQDKSARALIIAPTRELAQQIEAECKQIAKGSGLNGVLLIGGVGIGPQLRDLRSRPRIVIGTPGRIMDHLDRQSLDLSAFKLVVLDEVDRMLDMGFLPSVTTILAKLPAERQSFFFSATLDGRVRQLIGTFAREPQTFSLKTGETADNVHQDVVPYSDKTHKLEMLHKILIDDSVEKIIVFDDTQRSVERLSKELVARGFQADAIHGGKSQGQRQRALDRFKKSEVTVLVATDVAARGIDVADITHVINYSTPQTYED